MKASQRCVDLICEFEGCKLTPYKDSAGKMSVGIGHLIKPGEHFTTITEQEAEEILKQDIGWAESAVNQAVSVDLNQNQFDALVSLVFNVGGGAFLGSGLLKLVEEERFDEAGDRFLKWNKIGGLASNGLTRRRKAERELFLREMV